MLLLLLFSTTLLIGTSTTVLYSDPDNGTLDPNCWTVTKENYYLTKKDSQHLKVNVQVTPSYTEVCQQTWTYESNGTCQCGRDILGAVNCDSKRVSIQTCNCMTYDDVKGVLVGSCPYGCGLSNDSSSWSRQVYKCSVKVNEKNQGSIWYKVMSAASLQTCSFLLGLERTLVNVQVMQLLGLG